MSWSWSWALLLDLASSWLRCIARPGNVCSLLGCVGPATLIP